MQAVQQALEGASTHASASMSGLTQHASAGSMGEDSSGDSSFTVGSIKNLKKKGSSGFLARLTPGKQYHPLIEKAVSLQALDIPFYPAMPYRIFASFMGTRKNEHKNTGVGGQVGFIMNPILEELRIGVSYSYLHNDNKEYTCTDIKTSFGAMKAKTTTNNTSAVVAWNVNHPGIMGHIVGSYGWGNVRTARSFSQEDKVLTAKGNPKIKVYGVAIQLGYNIPLADESILIGPLDGMVLTPYFDVQMIHTSWKSFKEYEGFITADIGDLNQKIYEETLGLRHSWRLSEMFELQSWGAYVASQKTCSSFTSKILGNVTNTRHYSISECKQNISEAEIGLLLSIYFDKNLGVGVNGSIRTKSFKSLSREDVSLSMWYDF